MRLWQVMGMKWRKWAGGPWALIRYTGASRGGSGNRTPAAGFGLSSRTAESGIAQEQLATGGAG